MDEYKQKLYYTALNYLLSRREDSIRIWSEKNQIQKYVLPAVPDIPFPTLADVKATMASLKEV